MSEAKIRVNGVLLSAGAAMTIRVALESFRSSLLSEGLGKDEQGKRLVAAYLDQLTMIAHAMDQAGKESEG